MSQPAQAKKSRQPRKKATDTPPSALSSPAPASKAVPSTPKSQNPRTPSPRTPATKPKSQPTKGPPEASARKATTPKSHTAPRPAYASGPSQSDFIGLAVLVVVVALAVALFWLTGQHGLGAVGSSLPLLVAA